MKKFSILTLMLIMALWVKGQKLSEDTIVNKVFNQREIISLEKLLRIIDEEIASKTKISNNISNAYHNFFDTLHSHLYNQNWKMMRLEENIRNILLEDLKKENLFEEIFIEQVPRRARIKNIDFENPTFIKFITLNPTGKYRELLKIMGQSDTFFREIDKSFETAGDLSPALSAGILAYNKKFDFNIDRIRLFGAIFYLRNEMTLEEQYERYLERKNKQ